MFYIGENEVFNFNFFDYVIGFDELDFRDCYLRMFLYYDRLYYKVESVNDIIAFYKIKDDSFYVLKKFFYYFKENYLYLCVVVNGKIDFLKRGFVSFVVSNFNVFKRNVFYDVLNVIELVIGGGSVKNILGYKVKNKNEFLS